jgi:hypothetical protein
MKSNLPIIVLAVILTATGCNSGNKEQTTTDNAASITDLNTQNPTDSVASSIAPISSPTEATIPATPGTNNAIALNPAHGAPGHRCDIEVGQPLNSAPVASPAPQPAAQPVKPALPQLAPPPAPVINSQPANSKLALNPEHGLPGHRCDIAVGAPLN